MTDTTDHGGLVRRALAAATLLIPVIVVLVSWLMLRDQLPSHVATHWSGLGTADDVMPVAGAVSLGLVMSGAAAVAGLVFAFWPGLGATVRRGGFFFVGIFAGIGAATWLVSALLTLQAGDPYQAVLGGWIVLPLVAVGYGLIPAAIAPKPVLTTTDHVRRLDFAPTETGAWSRTITGRIFVWVALIIVVVGGVGYGIQIAAGNATDALFGIVTLALVLLLVIAFAHVRVTVDWRGLRLTSSVFRLPLKRIRLDQIDTVETAELRPGEWGGWGYRIMPGRSAYILGKGPGLIVTTTNQKQFAITLPDPETPAALLATLRDETRTQ